MSRLFVAVRLPAPAIAAATETAAMLSACLPDAVAARWVSPANMHLTVRFIGHVEEGRVPGILGVLSPPLHVAPFDVQLD